MAMTPVTSCSSPSDSASPIAPDQATPLPGSAVTITAVGLNPLRTGLLETLREMDADLTVTGARPVYFKPTRNGYGMIGLVPLKRFSPENVRELIAKSPFTAGARSDSSGLGWRTATAHSMVPSPSRIARPSAVTSAQT